MYRFIEQPHLPKTKLRHVIIGEKYRKTFENSDFCGKYDVIWMPDDPYIDERLSGHCDLSVLHLGKNRLVLAEYLRNTAFSEKLISLGAELSYMENAATKNYPDDSALNVCILNKYVIANSKTANKTLVNYLTNNRELIVVKQGYTKCSVCVLSDSAIITADRMIADKAKQNGIDCLRINEGFVELTGYEYGFIGGASFKTSNDKIVFTGSLDDHPDRVSIESFASDHGVKIEYLTNTQIFDIGSAIPLTEYI